MFRASSLASICDGSISAAPFVAAASAAAPCSLICSSSLLPDVDAGDRARDHQPLNLGGALEDVVDLRVAVHALNGVLARVAVAAEDLDRPFGGPHGDLAGLQLRHRALGVG